MHIHVNFFFLLFSINLTFPPYVVIFQFAHERDFTVSFQVKECRIVKALTDLAHININIRPVFINK